MVRRTDRPAMTIAVDVGRKATKHTNKQKTLIWRSCSLDCDGRSAIGFHTKHKQPSHDLAQFC